MLKENQCALVVIDVQGKLARLMHDKEQLFANIKILIKAAKILDIPIVFCQQYPEGLGQTIDEIAELLEDYEPVNKTSFSCAGNDKFCDSLKATGKKQLILCGIETHVCVYQTVMDLLANGYEAVVVADAVSSRTLENKQIALNRMQSKGAELYSSEMVLFELIKNAKHLRFKEIAQLVKQRPPRR